MGVSVRAATGTDNSGVAEEWGLTLIELLVVMIIIAVLAGIAIPVFLQQRERGWDIAVRADLRNAATAEETYLASHEPGAFATTVAGLQTAGFRPSPGRNYFGATFAMTVAAQGAQSYCLTARSMSGTWFAQGSATGSVQSSVGIDPNTCMPA
jgi:type IV pilus assembly protein PilA